MLVLDRKTPKLFPCHRSEKTLAKSNHCHTSKTHRNNLCVCHTSETPLGGLPISVRPKRGRKEHLSRHRSAPIPYPPSSHTLTHSLAQRPSHNSFPINRLHTLSIATGGVRVCVGTQLLRVATTTYCEQVFGLTQFLAMTCSCHTDSCTPLASRQKRRPAHKSGVQLVAGSTFQLPPEKVLEVAHLLRQQIQFARQALNFRFGAAVDGVVQFTAHAILHVLAVLAHHDDRRLDGREQRQDEIQQDKRIGVPGRPLQAYVDGRIGAAQDEKTNDEGPRPAELHHGVRDALGNRRVRLDHFVRIAHGAKAHELLRRVELPPQHRQHIHSRVRLALQQRRDVSAADFQALRILDGRRVGLMRSLFQHRRETKELAVSRLIHHNFLLIFVHRGDTHFSGDHHVGLPARVAHLVDALPRNEILQLYLPRQYRRLVFIEQGKQGDMFQHFGIAGHRPPLLKELGWFLVFQALESNATGNIRAPSKPDARRGFKKHSAKVGNNRCAETQRPTAHASLNDLNFYVLSRGMPHQQRGHSLSPAVETFRAAKRNDHREDFFRCRRHHGSFGIARRAAVRPGIIAEQRQAFQIQIVLADTLVRFARASRAKNNFAGHVRQIIQSNRQAAFHRHEIDHVHNGVDLRQAFPCNHSPQQSFCRTAVSRRIFSQRFVRFARHFNLRRLQHAAREGQFLNFRFSRLHLLEQRRRRCARLHARRHASQCCSRALRFQFRINRYFHPGLSLPPVSAAPKSAAKTLPGALFRSRGSVRVFAKRRELLPPHTRCGSACTRAAESPAAPDPFSRARQTSAFRSPPSESRLPDKARSPAPRPETVESERAAETPGHQYILHVRPAAARWARLHPRYDCRETRWKRCGISDTPLPAPRSIPRQSLPGRVPPVRRRSGSLRSKLAGLFAVAPACRRWCRETRRCSPCHLFSRTWCSRRRVKTFRAQSRAEFFARSPARAA